MLWSLQTAIAVDHATTGIAFGGPSKPTDQQKQNLLRVWNRYCPNLGASSIPQGWKLASDDAGQLFDNNPEVFLSAYGDRDGSWALEHAFHFYGTPIPVICNDMAMLLSVRGRLFVKLHDSSRIMLLHSEVTLPWLLEVLGTRFDYYNLLRIGVYDDYMFGFVDLLDHFDTYGTYEKHYSGRNRWAEMKSRGGSISLRFRPNSMSME